MKIKRIAALAAAVLVTSAAPAAAQSGTGFTDWTTASTVTDTASGNLKGVPVTLKGPEVQEGLRDSEFTGFASSCLFTPALDRSDSIAIGAQNPGYGYTITFGEPGVKDPVLHLASLASELSFPVGTIVTKLADKTTLGISGSTVFGFGCNPDQNSDSNGSVQLKGTFRTISFAAKPAPSAPNGDGFYLQIGTPFSA